MNKPVADACASVPQPANHAPASRNPAVLAAEFRPRLVYLDGLRGLAIVLVVLYHAYARWPELVPFGHRFEQATPFAQGKLGVELFFMISGYVIFMTLERSSGFGDFMLRRWLRLFPAMLGASLLIYASAPFFVRPQGVPTLRDLLPGLSFFEPAWWESLLGTPQGVLEGSFWSLYVEVKFYFVVGIAYFWLGPRAAITTLTVLFLTPIVDRSVAFLRPLNETAAFLNAGYWGWFVAGALYFLAARSKNRWMLSGALAISLVAALNSGYTKAAVALALLFCLTQCSPLTKKFFELRFWVFMGGISYPLYLVHENMMVSLIVSTGHAVPWLADALIPLLPIGVVMLIAWILGSWIEPRIRNRLQAPVRWLRRSLSSAAR